LAYEALRQVAFDERRKIHDLLIEGVELALKKRVYPPLAEMKAKSQGEGSLTWDLGEAAHYPYRLLGGFAKVLLCSALCSQSLYWE
jgi:hypothetical protein